MELNLQRRTVIGKKVAALRRRGLTPANLYGKGLASVALEVATADLNRLLTHADRNQVITLRVGASPAEVAMSYDVVVRETQREFGNGPVKHIDFYRINVNEAIEGQVAVQLVGEPALVASRGATLAPGHATLQVLALPGAMPSFIEVDTSGLTLEVEVLRAKDITLPAGVTLVSELETVLAQLIPNRTTESKDGAEAAEATPA